MVVLLSGSYALRRLVLLVVVFVACVLFLRSYSASYNDYLPSWKTSQVYNPDDIRPEDIISKPEDILPQLQDIPPELVGARPSSDENPNSSPRSRISLEMQEYLSWDPPVEIKDHYPPYDAYRNRDYDPNRWESFEQNNGFYINGTTRRLPLPIQIPTIYEVYPDYNSAEWLEKWRGEHVSCNGPTGIPYNTSTQGFVMAYDAIPVNFPKPDVGSYEAVGLDGNVCFDRSGRLGAYGLNDNEEDFRNVRWGKLQNECLERNGARYKLSNVPVLAPGLSESNLPRDTVEDLAQKFKPRAGEESLRYKPRTAVLIRTWDNYVYQENDIQAVRSLVSELSLQSGGEYHVFLFVNVKDSNLPIFTDTAVYQKALEDFVPEELRDIAILWTEKVCMEWYPKVGEWSVYFQQFMPLQWFVKTHPEYDYVWNWEMDARYIGHHYHFLEEIATFARLQPRKYMWERNSRYYFPAAHGSYEDFVRDTHVIIADSPHLETVWGAQPWSPVQKTFGPKPPTKEDSDDFDWGVDEEADFITLLPMWDPRNTKWAYRDKLWGYSASDSSTEDRPYPHIPRRTFVNTLTRFSARLLNAMHEENKLGVSMASEMWPSSTALQHGLKAIYAPHPIWLSHHWPAEYLDQVFNADGWGAGSLLGTNMDDGHGAAYDANKERLGQPQTGTGPNGEGLAGRWSQEGDSVYNPDREHNFGGWSWYFWSDFPKTLYWRWLGWQSSFTIVTVSGQSSDDLLKDENWGEWENSNGRMCLPGMLLHPVKNVQPPAKPVDAPEEVEQDAEDEEVYMLGQDDKQPSETTVPSGSDDSTLLTSSGDIDDDSHADELLSSNSAASGSSTDADHSSDATLPATDTTHFNSPFQDASPLDDNSVSQDHRLTDLPLTNSHSALSSFQGTSLLDDNTLIEDTRLEDLPLEASHLHLLPPLPSLPQIESAVNDTPSFSTESDQSDVASSEPTIEDVTSLDANDDISQDDPDTRPHELPPHAEFAYGGANPPSIKSTLDSLTITTDASSDVFSEPVVEGVEMPELPAMIDDKVTYDKDASIDNTLHTPPGPPPIPGTDDAPGYEGLFGEDRGAANPSPPPEAVDSEITSEPPNNQ